MTARFLKFPLSIGTGASSVHTALIAKLVRKDSKKIMTLVLPLYFDTSS